MHLFQCATVLTLRFKTLGESETVDGNVISYFIHMVSCTPRSSTPVYRYAHNCCQCAHYN